MKRIVYYFNWRQVVQYSLDVYGCHPSQPTQRMISCVTENADNGFTLDIMIQDYWVAKRLAENTDVH